ncbi:MAG: hypothetical protein WA001_01400 [Patescibacteria group bacterium]
MASFASEVSGTQMVEFFGRFGRFGGDMRQLKKLLTDDEYMRHWVQSLVDDEPEPSVIHGLFSTTELQLARVREWNKEFGWGIPDEAFAAVEKSVPAWPDKNLVAVVLVPYLADKANEDGTVTTGLERTFHELWTRAKAEQHANRRWDGYDKAGSDRLRLLKGIEHKVGLRWEVIDLGCNRNKKLMNVRNSKSSPSAGILAAAALHPNWVKSMDGDKVPYVFISGYEVQVPDERPWAHVSDLSFDSDDRGIQLGYGWCGYCSSCWAVPSFFRE